METQDQYVILSNCTFRRTLYLIGQYMLPQLIQHLNLDSSLDLDLDSVNIYILIKTVLLIILFLVNELACNLTNLTYHN